MPQQQAGIAFGPLHQRVHRFELGLEGFAQRLHTQFGIAGVERTQIARQHVGTVLHVGNGLRLPCQCLRHRLGQALRLHQRLPHGGQLLGRPT